MEKAEQHLPPTFLGLTRAEAKRWSVIRAVKAIATDPFKMPGAEYERELSDAVARNLGRPPNPGYLYVPLEVQQRVMLAGTAAAGGNLIGTQSYIPGASFASALRAQDPLAAFNIERFGPMTGDFGMPRVGTALSAQWLSETGTATEPAATVTQQHAKPRTCASYFQVSRSLLKSAPPEVLDALAITESARAVSAAVAAAFVAGTGTTAPTGILSVSGVPAALGTSINFAAVLNAVEAVEGAGLADPARAGFIIGTGAAKLLRTRERQSGAGSILQDAQIEGYRAIVTGACPSNALLFGDWSRAGLAEWGMLQIGGDPFSQFQSGALGIRAIYSVDVLCLQPTAFAASTGIT